MTCGALPYFCIRYIMDILFTPENLLSLVTLTFMEIVLGIDNLVFLSIISGKLPKEQQPLARRIGLGLALGMRLILLAFASWLVSLKDPVFHIAHYGFSWRDIILLLGGVFLIYKATTEIHDKLEGIEGDSNPSKAASFTQIIIQIVLLDIVFSFDSILTAVGLVDHLSIMIIAVLISMLVMLIFVNSISDFIERHPSLKMLALSFLILIGVTLIGEGMPEELHLHVPKGYVYFTMFFSFALELLNMRMRRASAKPVNLRDAISEKDGEDTLTS